MLIIIRPAQTRIVLDREIMLIQIVDVEGSSKEILLGPREDRLL